MALHGKTSLVGTQDGRLLLLLLMSGVLVVDAEGVKGAARYSADAATISSPSLSLASPC